MELKEKPTIPVSFFWVGACFEKMKRYNEKSVKNAVIKIIVFKLSKFAELQD